MFGFFDDDALLRHKVFYFEEWSQAWDKKMRKYLTNQFMIERPMCHPVQVSPSLLIYEGHMALNYDSEIIEFPR